ncbi:MAG: amino acid adenylation domain-containing protein [Rubripirellula sp.]|nr:amino acid adenylation domain-containing protein [Rubripirellula sp.]
MQEDAIQSFYPLSPLQEGILYESLANLKSNAYSEQVTCSLVGRLDSQAFKSAWQEVVNRHAILRTSFVWEEVKEPLQVVHRHAQMQVLYEDMRDTPSRERDAKVEAWRRQEEYAGFDFSKPVLMRVLFIQTEDDRHELIWTFHHLLLDGWSMFLILQELFTTYESFRENKPLDLVTPRPFRDLVVWQKNQDLSAAESYWRRALAGIESSTPLVVDHSPPPRSDRVPQFDWQETHLSSTVTASLHSTLRQWRVTMNTLMQGIWALLLSRYSGNETVVFGGIVSGRPPSLQGVESMVGLFINTLPVCVKCPDDMEVNRWLGELQVQQLEMRQYEHSPLNLVQRWSNVPSGQPLFESILQFENYPKDSPLEEMGKSIAIQKVRWFDRTNFPLVVLVEPKEQLGIRLLYDTDRFDAQTIKRMLGHLETLLMGIAENPHQRLGDLPLVTPKERQTLLFDWNQTASDYPQDKAIHKVFEEQVARTPNATALVLDNAKLTYDSLNKQANQFAHYLHSLGVGTDTAVAICCDRSFEMIVGVLGILKAGAAYVPLDASYPDARLRLMFEDAKPPVIVTQQRYYRRLKEFAPQVICLDAACEQIARQPCENPDCAVDANGLAYIMYTSGSTGRPKGTLIPHRGVVRLVKNNTYVSFGPNETFLQFATLSFDASTFEIWGPLLNGGRLVLFPRRHASLEDLSRVIQDTGVTTLWLTAGLFHEMMNSHPGGLRGVRQLLAGGDVLSVEHVRRSLETLEGCTIINGYGPTENTTFTCCYPITHPEQLEATVPIGRPISNTRVYVLDSEMRPVPVGIPGELCIGGDGLAREYLNDPELSNQKFVSSPFVELPDERLYRTGDLCRYLPDGRLEFLGRRDQQVKIRGFRIELGEVEQALREHSDIRDVIAVASDSVSGQTQLVAYLISVDSASPTVESLRSYLARALPDYMIPAFFIFLDAFPLTGNGKVDRSTLPRPERSHFTLNSTHVAPRSSIENSLVKIWSDVLGIESVGVTDNFFELGGDSILTIQAISRAKRAGISLAIHQVFAHPTIAELAQFVDVVRFNDNDQSEVTGTVPLTPIQHWFFEQRFVAQHHWNMAMLLEAQPNVRDSHLREAVRHLLVHHDMLRARFKKTESVPGWQQMITPFDGDVPFEAFDLSLRTKEEQDAIVREKSTELQASLDLQNGPLIRFAYFNCGFEQPARLLIIAHHLVIDGVSWRIILEDIQVCCEQLAKKQEVQLAPKSTSFQDWAHQLTTYSQSDSVRQQFGFWKMQNGEPISCLPVDFEVDATSNSMASACTVSSSLTELETHSLLYDLPKHYHARIDELLLFALTQSFSNWTHQSSLVLHLEGHGREDLPEGLDVSRTVGWFTTMYPVRLDWGETHGVTKTLRQIKQQLRNIPQRGISHGLLRYLNQETASDLGCLQHPEVSFNYLGQFDQGVQCSYFRQLDAEIGLMTDSEAQRFHVLDISGIALEKCLHLNWMYSSNIHRESTIQQLANGFVNSLRSLIARAESNPDASSSYVPSDFPLSRLDQSQLDRLIEKKSSGASHESE